MLDLSVLIAAGPSIQAMLKKTLTFIPPKVQDAVKPYAPFVVGQVVSAAHATATGGDFKTSLVNGLMLSGATHASHWLDTFIAAKALVLTSNAATASALKASAAPAAPEVAKAV